MLAPLVKSKAFEGLKSEIIDKNYCTFCGSCASFCSHIVLKDKPVLETDCAVTKENVLKCSENGTCYDACPMTETDIPALEQAFLDGEADGDLGIIKEMTAARTKAEGQDGGVVTSLLVAGIEKGIFDAVIVAKRHNGFQAVPVVADKASEIIDARGSKYMAVPMVSALGAAVREKNKRKIALVGTPCEVLGVRKIQRTLLANVPQIEVTVIGLFCMENFVYDALKQKISELLKVDLDSAHKANISKGNFIVSVNGQAKSCKVTDLHDAVRPNCAFCTDFTSRLADISIGSVGSPGGYSTAIIRSKKGKELFELLEAEKKDVNKDEIIRVASLKKKRVSELKGDAPPALRGG